MRDKLRIVNANADKDKDKDNPGTLYSYPLSLSLLLLTYSTHDARRHDDTFPFLPNWIIRLFLSFALRSSLFPPPFLSLLLLIPSSRSSIPFRSFMIISLIHLLTYLPYILFFNSFRFFYSLFFFTHPHTHIDRPAISRD